MTHVAQAVIALLHFRTCDYPAAPEDPRCAVAGGGSPHLECPSGIPCVHHMYSQFAWNPVRKRFLIGAGAGTWEYDPAVGGFPGWGPRLTTEGASPNLSRSSGIADKVMFYDPPTDRMYWVDDSANVVQRFDYSTNQWSNWDTTAEPGNGDVISGYNHWFLRYRVVGSGGHGGIEETDVDMWAIRLNAVP